MDRATNSLLLKANRALSSRLSDLSLVELDRLDEANEIFVGRLREGDLIQCSLLRVLLYDLQCLDESRLLDHQLQRESIGGIDLTRYAVPETLSAGFPIEECIATWTVPIDLMGDVYCLTSAYYLSDFVRHYWEEKLGSNVVWYASSMSSLESFFDLLHERSLATAEEEDS